MMAAVDRTAVARMIDHTLLAPEATTDRVRALCAEAIQLGVGAVCVSPNQIALAAGELRGSDVGLAAVVGFPSGAHRAEVKAAEAGAAHADGAGELDMVVPLGAVVAGEWTVVSAHVAAVRAAAGPALLKVIIESAALDDAQIDQVCRVAVDAGADYVKTSTGFHPSGGASVEAVRRMRAAVGWDVGVKASGGIRDAAAPALAMIEAGATRIGASASAAILDGI